MVRQGKRVDTPESTWWNVIIPRRWRHSAPDATRDAIGPASSYAERQVAERLRDSRWADQAHVPPLAGRGSDTMPAPLPPAVTVRNAAANRVHPT